MLKFLDTLNYRKQTITWKETVFSFYVKIFEIFNYLNISLNINSMNGGGWNNPNYPSSASTVEIPTEYLPAIIKLAVKKQLIQEHITMIAGRSTTKWDK